MPVDSARGGVFLVEAVHIAPRRSKTVEVTAIPMNGCEDDIGVVTLATDIECRG